MRRAPPQASRDPILRPFQSLLRYYACGRERLRLTASSLVRSIPILWPPRLGRLGKVQFQNVRKVTARQGSIYDRSNLVPRERPVSQPGLPN